MAKVPRYRSSPEAAIQRKIVGFLKLRGWVVERMHGNAYQMGIPDLFCYHDRYSFRWVDVKVQGQYRYTKAQCQKWTRWEESGLGVWIMVDATEAEYAKLFEPPNFRAYWKKSYDKYITPISEIMKELK